MNRSSHDQGERSLATGASLSGRKRARGSLFEAIKTRLRIDEAPESLVANYYETFSGFFEPEPAVAAALGALRRAGWTVAVVTNGNAPQIRKVAAAGLEPLVDVVCISAVEGVQKPDPKLLEIAASRAGVGLDAQSWMIGDNADADVGAAVAAGIRSVWLRRGRLWERRDYAPTVQADTFEEAADIVLASQARETTASAGPV